MKKLKSFLLLLGMFLTMAAFAFNRCEAATARIGIDPSKLPHKLLLGASVSAYQYGGRWGLFELNTNKIMTLPIYSDVKTIPGEPEYIAYTDGSGYWGIIDCRGDWGIEISQPIYETIEDLPYYYFKVSRNGKYGWLEKQNGNVVQGPFYSEVNFINNSLLFCVCTDSGCGIARAKDAKVVKPVKYPGEFQYAGSDEYFIYYSGGGYGVVDIMDAVIAPPKYRGVKNVTYDAIYITDGGKKLGLLRMRDGKQIAQPIYDKISKLEEPGFYKVKKDGKWGAIDYDGNLIFECKYGPLEMNKMVRNYPDNQKFKDAINYNYYYDRYLEAYYYLDFLEANGRYAENILKKILSDENKSQEIKDKANELINKYGVDRSKL